MPPYGTTLRPQPALQAWTDSLVRLPARSFLSKYPDRPFLLFKLTDPTVLLSSKSRASTSFSPSFTAIDGRQDYGPVAADHISRILKCAH